MEHDKVVAGNGASAKHAKPAPEVKDALREVRAAAQDLHGALTDAVAKRGGAMKADLVALPKEAMALIESVKGSMAAENEVTKKNLSEAVTHLEALQKHIGESLKSSGHQFQSSVRQAVIDARASVQKVSEAVAEQRSAARKPTTPTPATKAK